MRSRKKKNPLLAIVGLNPKKSSKPCPHTKGASGRGAKRKGCPSGPLCKRAPYYGRHACRTCGTSMFNQEPHQPPEEQCFNCREPDFFDEVPAAFYGSEELKRWLDADSAGRRAMVVADDARHERERQQLARKAATPSSSGSPMLKLLGLNPRKKKYDGPPFCASCGQEQPSCTCSSQPWTAVKDGVALLNQAAAQLSQTFPGVGLTIARVDDSPGSVTPGNEVAVTLELPGRLPQTARSYLFPGEVNNEQQAWHEALRYAFGNTGAKEAMAYAASGKGAEWVTVFAPLCPGCGKQTFGPKEPCGECRRLRPEIPSPLSISTAKWKKQQERQARRHLRPVRELPAAAPEPVEPKPPKPPKTAKPKPAPKPRSSKKGPSSDEGGSPMLRMLGLNPRVPGGKWPPERPEPKGYRNCECRGCFATVIHAYLCGDCENAGCDPLRYSECQRVDISYDNPRRRRRKKNPTAQDTFNGQRLDEERVPLDEAAQLPHYDAAVRRYEEFHGGPPTDARVIRVDDGKRGVTRKVVTALGEVPETHYRTPWRSQKATGDDFSNWEKKFNKSKKKGLVHWVHHHLEGGMPLEVLDPETGLTIKLPTTESTQITDYWYD